MSSNLLPAFRGPGSYSLLIAVTLLIYIHSVLGRLDLAATDAAEHSVSALHLINLIFLTGASAGAIVVSAVVGALRLKRARPIARAAELGAATGLALVTMFIVLDVLRPGRLWQFGRADLVSALIDDVPIMAIYLAHAMAIAGLASQLDLMTGIRKLSPWRAGDYMVALARSMASDVGTTRGRSRVWRLAKVLIPAAVLLRSTPAWMAGLAHVEPSSRLLLLAAPCYISCVVSGLALVAVAATTSRIVRTLEIRDDAIRTLGEALRFLVPLLGYCLVAEMWLAVDARDPIRHHLFPELVTGSYAPLFWFALIGGVIIPFLLLASTPAPGVGRIRIRRAALLVILGVFVARWNTLVPALLGHAHRLYAAGGYAPTVSETSLTIAVYAIGFLVHLSLTGRIARAEQVADCVDARP